MGRKKGSRNKETIRKERKIIIISMIIIVVVLLLIFFFRWFFVDRIVSRNNIDLTSDEAISLVGRIKSYSYFDKLGDFEISNISNQDKLWFIVETDETYDKELNFYQEGSVVSEEMVNNFFNRYFYEEEISNEDILCSKDKEIVFDYSSETKTYTANTNYHHHLDTPIIYDKYLYPLSIEKIEKANGDILYEVSVHKMFGDYCSDICDITNNFYGTYEDSLNKENVIVNSNNYENWEDYFVSEKEIEKLYNIEKDNFPTYKYVFVFENNTYYLKSVEISK